MSRDPSQPIPERPVRVPRSICGYALAESGEDCCGQPSVYTFRVKGWREGRIGNTCPEHALIVRRWDVEYMTTAVTR